VLNSLNLERALLAEAWFTKEPGRLLIAIAVTFIGLGLFFALMKRPKSDQPATWAQSMLGALGVYALFLLGYGAVPHEWLTWADSGLGLREDKVLIKTYPITVSGRALRDSVAAMIYIVFLGVNVVFWMMWQKRGQKKPNTVAAATPEPAGTSAFSRPVTKKD
jgi:hypothetical protein